MNEKTTKEQHKTNEKQASNKRVTHTGHNQKKHPHIYIKNALAKLKIRIQKSTPPHTQICLERDSPKAPQREIARRPLTQTCTQGMAPASPPAENRHSSHNIHDIARHHPQTREEFRIDFSGIGLLREYNTAPTEFLTFRTWIQAKGSR